MFPHSLNPSWWHLQIHVIPTRLEQPPKIQCGNKRQTIAYWLIICYGDTLELQRGPLITLDFSKVFSGEITSSTKIRVTRVSLGQTKPTRRNSTKEFCNKGSGLWMMQSALKPQEISQRLEPQPQSRACQQKVDHYHAALSTVVFTFMCHWYRIRMTSVTF